MNHLSLIGHLGGGDTKPRSWPATSTSSAR